MGCIAFQSGTFVAVDKTETLIYRCWHYLQHQTGQLHVCFTFNLVPNTVQPFFRDAFS